jgi:hypothetical protein
MMRGTPLALSLAGRNAIMNPRRLLLRSLAAVAAAFAIASLRGPLDVAAKASSDEAVHAQASGHGQEQARASEHDGDGHKSDGRDSREQGDSEASHGSGDDRRASRTGGSASLSAHHTTATAPAATSTKAVRVTAHVAALGAAPAAAAVIAVVPAPALAAPAVAVRPAPEAPAEAPALGGLIALPQGPLPGAPGAFIGGDAAAWQVVAAAEGLAIVALAGALWQRRRRSTAGRR